jgi:hypothetical protein
MEISLREAEFMYVGEQTDGLTDRRDGTKCRLLQFRERAKKLNLNIFVLANQNDLDYAGYGHLLRNAESNINVYSAILEKLNRVNVAIFYCMKL